MITIENIQDGTYLEGHELEYFVDDDTLIGEVYLDGNLIYQSTSIYNEKDLKVKFKEIFAIDKEDI